MQPTSYRLGRHDRIKISGAAFRPVYKIGREHLLQLVKDGVLEDHYKLVSDEELGSLMRTRKLRIEKDHFSLAQQLLKARGDDSHLSDLGEEDLRTIAWKVEWCTRFEGAHREGRFSRTPRDFQNFIDWNKDSIHRWYIGEFGVSRPLGREFKGEERKTFDFPSPTTLRNWLDRFAAAGHRRQAFRLRYDECGNRHQLDSRALSIVERNVRRYASRGKLTIADVYEAVEADIDELNRNLPEGPKVYVSERAIRRRIRKLDPLFVDLGRMGPDRTRKKYTPVGSGLDELARMERVEMDDWDMDLFAVLQHKHARYYITDQARTKARSLRRQKITVRCTVTAAIDVATKCIVGLGVSPFAPSTPGSKSALRTIVADKSELAKSSGAQCGWPMHARPGEIATDGGPAFGGEFHESVVKLGINHRIGNGDPRSRGTIESFFRTFKRFCRMFTGQAFSNVVEKGDYPAEQMASLVVEDLERLLIRFIVDSYHHRPHGGLGGQLPYEAWKEATNDLDPPPDHIQRQIAFGIPLHDRAISAAGIRYLHVDYKHSKMGVLHGLIGRGRLTVVVDPHDMGAILVLVKDDLRSHFSGDGDYMTFTAEGYEGISVAQHLSSNRTLREFERKQAELGAPFRLGAFRALRKEAEELRIKAGVPSDEIDPKLYRKFVSELEHKGALAAAPRMRPTGAPMNGDDGTSGLGTVVVTVKPAASSNAAPSSNQSSPTASLPGKSINLYNDEDDA
jgi:transposase InsO family protein